MAKVPFKVSARTARLIGRENIASSKGAIIELVKNAYDADSPLCIIYFSSDSLFIIDAGEGMTQNIIANHWMTIGTNNKEDDYFTQSGRIKAGAKGIGRFALDKLGSKCEMITKFNSLVHKDIDDQGKVTNYVAYHWNVDWNDFEGEFKTIDKVEADLIGYKQLDLKQYIIENIHNKKINKIIDTLTFSHGTLIQIDGLREKWEDYFIDQLYSDLEVLIPPKEHSSFQLFLISEQEQDKYGEVFGSVCDDYDYKLVARADKNQKVKIKIYRNEYDITTIPLGFFNRTNLQTYPYRKIDFQRKKWIVCKTFSQLLPGYNKIDKEQVFSKIGKFTFTIYYMKRTYSEPDLKKFYYDKFNAKNRQSWLNKFGGIKLFRDDFRVRPYGEVNDSAFDWLGLGGRKSKNPAPTSHPSGKWKVEPDNVSGAITISRLSNINFEDKSSREGLQENKTFQIFKLLILQIIQVLETDRAKISNELFNFYKELNQDKITDKDIEKITDKVLSNSENEDKEKVFLVKTIQNKDEQIKQFEGEQKILRGMATSGIVTASFTHELGNLSDVLSNRIDELKELIEEQAPPSLFTQVEPFLNPYILLEDMKKQDIKLRNWLKFSLEAAKKDKRTRKKIVLEDYFENYQNAWQNVFLNRMIQFTYQLDDKNLDIRALEIDLDSIFNNLLVNSTDSFMRQKNNPNRAIRIFVKATQKEVIIDYFDNGEGISKDITDHTQIFQALYTTKRNEHTGEEIGTGLGMWLVATIIREYNGEIKLLYPQDGGFGLRIIFIRSYMKDIK